MAKGVLKVYKSNKGRVVVELDRLNGKAPMPLSYVGLPDTSLDGKDCEYEMVSGKITKIIVDGNNILRQEPPKHLPIRNVEHVQQQRNDHPRGRIDDSLNLRDTFLPKEVRNLPIHDIDNFSLKLYKAARFIPDNKFGKFYFYKNDYRRRKDGSESGHKFEISANFGDPKKFDAIKSRHENLMKSLFKNNYKKIRLHPDWRMVVGVGGGGASVYETGMTLHHVYGFPYIPATSIKGTLRSWIITEIFSIDLAEGKVDLKHAEDRALKNPLFVYIFGSDEKSYNEQHQKGNAQFFDAFPVEAPNLEVDIMNVHYPEWYNNKTAPTDFQNPNPIPFLTVARGSKFETFVGVSKNMALSNWNGFEKLSTPMQLSGEHTLLDLIYAWLTSALTSHGIGAKTAVGYGYMREVQQER